MTPTWLNLNLGNLELGDDGAVVVSRILRHSPAMGERLGCDWITHCHGGRAPSSRRPCSAQGIPPLPPAIPHPQCAR